MADNSAPMACCRVDGEPLVATFAFKYKEFVCAVCGALYEFLEPMSKPWTQELDDRAVELAEQWRTDFKAREEAKRADSNL